MLLLQLHYRSVIVKLNMSNLNYIFASTCHKICLQQRNVHGCTGLETQTREMWVKDVLSTAFKFLCFLITVFFKLIEMIYRLLKSLKGYQFSD